MFNENDLQFMFYKNAIAATFKYPKIKLAGKSMARTIT